MQLAKPKCSHKHCNKGPLHKACVNTSLYHPNLKKVPVINKRFLSIVNVTFILYTPVKKFL